MTPATVLPSDLARLLPQKAHTFAFATRFLPAEYRLAITVLYAYCRVMDDLVDEPGPGITQAYMRKQLGEWRKWLIAGQPSDRYPQPVPLAVALADVSRRYRIPGRFLVALLDGVESDIGPVRTPDFITLRRYCMRVAGSVGLAVCYVFRTVDPAAMVAAAHLGIAMQMTNILRDAGADLRNDRVYFPSDELARFGYSADALLEISHQAEPPDDRWRSLLRFQIDRTRHYYSLGLQGVWLLPREVQAGIFTAGRLYMAILDVIENRNYEVIHHRAATSRLTKVRQAILCQIMARLRHPAAHPQPLPEITLPEVLSWLD